MKRPFIGSPDKGEVSSAKRGASAAPWLPEDFAGEPFVRPAGRLLAEALGRGGPRGLGLPDERGQALPVLGHAGQAADPQVAVQVAGGGLRTLAARRAAGGPPGRRGTPRGHRRPGGLRLDLPGLSSAGGAPGVARGPGTAAEPPGGHRHRPPTLGMPCSQDPWKGFAGALLGQTDATRSPGVGGGADEGTGMGVITRIRVPSSAPSFQGTRRLLAAPGGSWRLLAAPEPDADQRRRHRL